MKSINNIVQQFISYHFQWFGFFPFLQIHILFYLLLPDAVIPVFANMHSVKALHFIHAQVCDQITSTNSGFTSSSLRTLSV